ncbi:hypothetical protein [Pedobacter frigiditerrae]|uniref:hypothetical protein n=1 Tax=Pedobacter frigiditerrae TaxID=2530452 RepID=UPI0029300F3E|nr:hypothetical protein [Pedobacter frigiditerrae]
MTHHKTTVLLNAAAEILQELLDKASEKQQMKIQGIFDEMKYSDRIDEEMAFWMENQG